MKNSIINQFIKIVKGEFAKSEGENKFLLLAMIANIPSPFVFLGYLTQAITIFLVLFFLKRVVDHNTGASYLYLIVGVTLLFQIMWFPFVSQLITITLLGLIFAIRRKSLKA